MNGRAAPGLVGYVWLVYGLLYLPVLLMGLFSFNTAPYIALPLEGLTIHWYTEVLQDGRLLGGLATTFTVAFPVMLATTVLGTLSAIVLVRDGFPFKLLFAAQLCLPFFLPRIVFAVAQVTWLAELGIPKSLVTVWLAQSLIILPFSTVIIASVLYRVDGRLEEAAADLGATGWQTFRLVTLPLMKNGILASAFVAFVLSCAEYTVSFFTSARTQPLSVLVASDFRFDLSPKLTALAMLIVLFNVLIVASSEIIRRRPIRL